MDIAALKQKVYDAVEANAEKIMEIGQTVWKNPEPGFREYKTAALAVETFRSLGLEYRDSLALTGVRADMEFSKEGPCVAILGEMDSLILPNHPECDPATGAIHACGHNCSMAGMLGAAIALKSAGIEKDLAGKIAFMAVPAEECIELGWRGNLIKEGKISALGGKAELIRVGAFNDVDLSYMLHASSAYGMGAHNGFLTKNVTFKGRATHAASPLKSVNALHIATLAQNAVALLRERWGADSSMRIHGIVTSGGDVVNIIPDEVKMEYLVRGSSLDFIKRISQEFDRAMCGVASAMGGGVEVQTIPGYMPQWDDEGLEEIYINEVHRFAPESKVTKFFHYGSTDMGELSTVMPTLHGYSSGAGGTGHGIDYRIEDPYKAYVGSARIIAGIAVELLSNGAAKAGEVAARREGKISIEEYIRLTDELNAVNSVALAE